MDEIPRGLPGEQSDQINKARIRLGRDERIRGFRRRIGDHTKLFCRCFSRLRHRGVLAAVRIAPHRDKDDELRLQRKNEYSNINILNVVALIRDAKRSGSGNRKVERTTNISVINSGSCNLVDRDVGQHTVVAASPGFGYITRYTMEAVSEESLLAWMAAQRDEHLFITSLTLAEIRRGILEKPNGKRRAALDAWFSGPEGPQALFAGRILPFDEKAGLVWARLMANGNAKGRSRSALDTIIAAVAEANECVVVTDNENDFEDVQIINPLRSESQEVGR